MSILDDIVQDTRKLTRRREKTTPVASLKQSPFFQTPTVSLKNALQGRPPAIIAEIKWASPSKGRIRNEGTVAEIAHQYKINGAAALSILTEPLHFSGALEYLQQARQTVDLPILRKDFITDPYQIFEARAYGADAVLLIATCLERSQLHDLYQAATELNLECLVEVYHASDLDKIDFDQVEILGINNRDLSSFDVDIDHSLELFRQVPESVVRVSESGLSQPRELAHIVHNNVNGALIGESLMRAREPGRKLAQLRQDTRELLKNAPEPVI